MPAPVIENAQTPTGDETVVIRQSARARRISFATLATWILAKVPTPQKGDKGDKGDAGAQGIAGPVGATGAVGSKGDVGSQGAVGASGSQGLKGDTGAAGAVGATGATGQTGAAGAIGAVGATGPAGTPKRVERFTGTTNASGIATITFSPAFTVAPDVDVIQGWNTDQEIGGAASSVTTTGCSVLVKVSRGTLLLNTGPFQTAGAGVSVTVRAIGN